MEAFDWIIELDFVSFLNFIYLWKSNNQGLQIQIRHFRVASTYHTANG